MASIISVVSEVVTACVGWIAQFVTVITSNPLLLMGVVLSFVGLSVGLIRRLMRL